MVFSLPFAEKFIRTRRHVSIFAWFYGHCCCVYQLEFSKAIFHDIVEIVQHRNIVSNLVVLIETLDSQLNILTILWSGRYIRLGFAQDLHFSDIPVWLMILLLHTFSVFLARRPFACIVSDRIFVPFPLIAAGRSQPTTIPEQYWDSDIVVAQRFNCRFVGEPGNLPRSVLQAV